MGRDNHNAGLHMIWRRHGWFDDDVRYYDRLALEEYNAKKNGQVASTDKNWAYGQEPEKGDDAGFNRGLQMYHKYMEYADRVMENIMYLALKKEKDAYAIIENAQNLVSSGPEEWNNYPSLYKAMSCLTNIADDLGCTVPSLFENRHDEIKKYVYYLIDQLKNNISDLLKPEGEIHEDGQAIITFPMYGSLTESTIMNVFRTPYGYIGMDLTLEKDVYDKGCGYSISYGDLGVRPNALLPFGAYLYYEEKGKLAEFIERMISKHPEWREEY